MNQQDDRREDLMMEMGLVLSRHEMMPRCRMEDEREGECCLKGTYGVLARLCYKDISCLTFQRH